MLAPTLCSLKSCRQRFLNEKKFVPTILLLFDFINFGSVSDGRRVDCLGAISCFSSTAANLSTAFPVLSVLLVPPVPALVPSPVPVPVPVLVPAPPVPPAGGGCILLLATLASLSPSAEK